MPGIQKADDSAVKDLLIQHLDANDNKIVDEWILRGAFIISSTYTKLDYSSDEVHWK